jgi:hypothetical protein
MKLRLMRGGARVGGRRERKLVALSWLAFTLAPSVVAARPVTERVGTVTLDYSAGVVAAPGAGAADLHLPSAQVARFKAERAARAHALAEIERALASLPSEKLGCKLPAGEARKAWIAEVAKRADKLVPSSIEWGSDGSVELELRVPAELLATAEPPRAGEPPRYAVLVDPKARPALLAPVEGGCAPAPRTFDDLGEARAALGAPVHDAEVISKADAKKRPDGAPRVIAVVRSADGGAGEKR